MDKMILNSLFQFIDKYYHRVKLFIISIFSSNGWDRPIVITIVGGIFLTMATTLWNTHETRRLNELEHNRSIYRDIFIKNQLNLISAFPKAFDNTGTIINSWLVHIMWVAEEKNKDKPRSKSINKWSKEITRLQQKYESSNPLEGIVKQIQVTYACSSVRKLSGELYLTWKELIQLHTQVNRDYNDGEHISGDYIKSYSKKRKKTLLRLESQKDSLLDAMKQELAGIRIGKLECMP